MGGGIAVWFLFKSRYTHRPGRERGAYRAPSSGIEVRAGRLNCNVTGRSTSETRRPDLLLDLTGPQTIDAPKLRRRVVNNRLLVSQRIRGCVAGWCGRSLGAETLAVSRCR